MSKRAVFLDKDGTLVENVPYNVDPKKIVLGPGAHEALGLLCTLGFRLFVVSNQPGVALGRFPQSALASVSQRLAELVAPRGVRFSGFYYCPHAPAAGQEGEASCGCRKPRPGLLHQAAREHDIDLAQSWLVGDILDDIEAGHRAGCKAVLLDNGNETQWQISRWRCPDHFAGDLLQAATIIASHSRVPEREIEMGDEA